MGTATGDFCSYSYTAMAWYLKVKGLLVLSQQLMISYILFKLSEPQASYSLDFVSNTFK